MRSLPIISLLTMAVSIAVGGYMTSTYAAPVTPAVVDSDGNMHVPAAYQAEYEFLGSWAIAASGEPGSKEIHNVYASPGAVKSFHEHGHFPDGAVLVKEVYTASTASMTTGTVSHAQTLKGWFVMVKGNGNYPNNRLWGNGWGWSWFEAANPSKTATVDYKTSCLACHIPAKATDWIYTSGYQTLK